MNCLLRVKEVSKILGINKNRAYNVIRALNNELKEQGYQTIRGRVNKAYLYQRLDLNKD